MCVCVCVCVCVVHGSRRRDSARRMWGPGGSSKERRALIRAHLGRTPEQGGYRDFMRHYCPHRHREVDPDFVPDEHGEFAAKRTYERFLERTVADVERVMFLADEVPCLLAPLSCHPSPPPTLSVYR